jgi:hypothetical protein
MNQRKVQNKKKNDTKVSAKLERIVKKKEKKEKRQKRETHTHVSKLKGTYVNERTVSVSKN